MAFTMLAVVMGAAYATMSSGLNATSRSDDALFALGLAESKLAAIGISDPLEVGKWREEADGWITETLISPFGNNAAAWTATGQRPLEVEVLMREAQTGRVSARLTALRLGLVSR